MAPRPEFMVEDATLLFKNFVGEERLYNSKGERNFNLVLDEDSAAQLAADGWNIKTLVSKEEDEPDRQIVEVKVSFKFYPPKIILITNGGATRTVLSEEMVEILDSLDVEKWDMMIQGSIWDVNGKTGIKAYLKSAYVTVREDELDRKYGALPPS